MMGTGEFVGHDRGLTLAIATAAILAPALHILSDVIEWWTGGFSTLQLSLGFVAFLAVPFFMVGLYAVQRPRVGALALVGAVLYGASFIYFEHTTLYALAESTSDYAALWAKLGTLYTLHGGVMVVGAFLFGTATLRAGVLPRWTALVFLAGAGLNLLFAVIPVPEIVQVIGNDVRNVGLIGMGFFVLGSASKP